MEKIRNLDEIIKEIENCDYIDCHKDEIFDDYQYENILYYFKQLKKQKEVIDKIEKYIEKQGRMYGLSMPIELGTHLDNILGILKEVSE